MIAVMALLLFMPWFALLGALYWFYPRTPRPPARRAYDAVVLLLALALSILGMRWGYAEGARLSRTLGGWQVISWALVLSMPIMLPMALLTMPATFENVSTRAWMGLAYVSLFSMLIGFVFWYRGLAQGGIAAVGQLQLFQPFMGLGLAALLLHEKVSWTMLVVTLVAVVCVAGAKRYAK